MKRCYSYYLSRLVILPGWLLTTRTLQVQVSTVFNKYKQVSAFLLLSLLGSITANAQSWQPLGNTNEFSQASYSGAYFSSMVKDANGNVYVAYQDAGNGYKLTVHKWDGSAWSVVGSEGISGASASYITTVIDASGNVYVAYNDAANSNKLTVQKWDGSAWSLVGGTAGISAGSASSISAVIDGTGNVYVAYTDGGNSNKLTVQKWDGNAWSIVGSAGISAGSASSISAVIDGSGNVYVAYEDGANSNKLTVQKWNGSIWSLVGGSAGISAGAVYYVSSAIDASGNVYVAYEDANKSGKLTVQKWDGSAWSLVGSSAGISAGAASYVSTKTDLNGNVFNVNVYVAYQDANKSNKLTVQKWDGSDWSVVGGSVGISADVASYISTLTDSNGNVYVAYTDQASGNKLTVQKWDGSDWSVVGGNVGISAGMINSTSTVADGKGNVYVPYLNSSNNYKLTVQKWDGSVWSYAGDSNGISAGTVSYVSAAADDNGNVYVAYQDNGNSNKLTVQKWDGNGWSYVGASTGISAGSANYISAVIDGSNHVYVAYNDAGSSGKLTVMKWDGSTWSVVGSAGISTSYAYYCSMATDVNGNVYVAYTDAGSSGKLTVQKWDGSVWSVLGSTGISAGYATYISTLTDSNGHVYVAYTDAGNSNKLTVQKWDSSAWSLVGGSAGISAGAVYYVSSAIDANGNVYAAYMDGGNSNKLTVQKWDGSAWSLVGGSAGISAGLASYVSAATDANGLYVAYGAGKLFAQAYMNPVAAPSNLSYTTPVNCVKNSSITPLNPTVIGTVTSYSISPALPAGLSINGTTGIISGIPTAISAATDYTVTASNSGGNTTAVVNIAVNDIAPAISYAVPVVIYSVGTDIGSLNLNSTGGAVVSYSVSPTLPAGLSMDAGTGIIHGTPTLASVATDYTVTAMNSGGVTSVVLNITVNDQVPAISYASPQIYTNGAAISPLIPASTGGVAVGYSVSPVLPVGLSLDASTGIISGTPTSVALATDYTVTATNSGGSATAVLSIMVKDGTPAISYNLLISTLGTAISPLSPTNTGGVAVSYSVSPALPAGLNINASTGVISGTPTVINTATDYTVTATNNIGTATAVVNITVNDVAPAISYGTSVVYNVGTSKSVQPVSTGGAVVSYSINPALPSGLSIDASTGIIGGTPTAISAATDYTITAANSGGSTTTIVNITVNDALPVISYTTPVVYLTTVSISALSPTVSGGTVLSYSISPALPTGLIFDTTTGIISGTPTEISTATDYTVTATNNSGSTTAVVNITVNDGSVITINLTTPSTTPIVGCENNSLVLSYTVSSGVATQYKITYSAAALAAGMQNVSYTALPSASGDIPIVIPAHTAFGTYSASLQLRNESGTESVAYTFMFTVNVSSDYIIPKFDDVVLCDNSSHLFTAYQWYKDGVAISGATKQFYSDPNGLSGSYSVKLTTKDGQTVNSCDKVLSKSSSQKVTAYPTQVSINEPVTVKVTGLLNEDLEGATLSVYTMQGVRVYRSTEVKESNSVTLPSIDGMYLGRVITSTGKEFQFKVIVAK